MKLALLSALALASFPALAETLVVGGSASGFVSIIVQLIIVGIIIGILLFLVARAPFIPAEGKQLITYVIYFVAALYVIFLLLGVAGLIGR